MPQRKSRQFDIWTKVAYYTSLGFILPAGLVAGYMAGWFLDKHLHTQPYLSLVGGLVGSVAGFIEVLQILTRTERNESRNDPPGDLGPR